jgi:hypothetical protein
MTQPFRDPSSHGRNAHLIELEDGFEVHLGGVDQIAAHG